MNVECLLCGEKFRTITNTHLRFVHGITKGDYRGMFPGAELTSDETGQLLSEGMMGKTNTLGYRHTEKSKQQMSKSQVGRVVSDETKQLLSEVATERMKNPLLVAQISESVSKAMMGHEVSEKTRQLISEVVKELWKDSEYAHSVLCRRRPNGPELQLQSVLDEHCPNEWKYVGDGQFQLGGKNPDFMNVNDKKQVIEIFGYHWHDPSYFPNRMSEEELIAHYKKFGFDCLVFWEYDVYNEMEVVERIRVGFGSEGDD